MPSQDFVDVRIISEGSPLTEYLDPQGDSDNGSSHTRYVEARTDQPFEIQVKHLPGFNFECAPVVYADADIDSTDAPWFHTIEKSWLNDRRGTLLSTEQVEFDNAKFQNDDTGVWEKFQYRFGALDTSEQILPGHSSYGLQGRLAKSQSLVYLQTRCRR
jgi:hypothetical protein